MYPQNGQGTAGQHQARQLTVADARLTRLLHREPERCASVSEYAAATGIPLGQILQLFAPALAEGAITFEPVGPEVFVHTAPNGRPVPSHMASLEPNLWERLRAHGDKNVAYPLWLLLRSMEDAGWLVESSVPAIMFGLAPVYPSPQLGLRIAQRAHPILVRPPLSELSGPDGHLSRMADAGASVVGVVVDSGALDEATTAVRKLYLSRRATGTGVLLLEEPRFAPLLLTPGDASVAPRSVTLATLETELS
jgi:hypothetical protein